MPACRHAGSDLYYYDAYIFGEWRSLVAHLVWDQGAGGSPRPISLPVDTDIKTPTHIWAIFSIAC